ncbi:Glu/Leu/Phe/Val dehydrogenase [Aeromicrobium sp. Root472D3]|uniref:Glu/Leu/Phe/Val family dehydrogenase n=1 Tax=Aeromicrobium sp. Root472D3 TaxID=1736540 RepID=UPI0006FA7ABA|nr:Glu/Leu/Phe/Val dehydrogenase dimerization domain-containing protein [Aeromicrobium sp. Root472D3]KQX74186.1 glutamate dehydrogenase [Aeromicrobium sp. Root472D3]
MLELIDEWGPEKVVMVSDRRTGMKGVLVIDNTALGMGKGGTRMSPTLTVDEVARLARTMTWKWAVSGLFHGGAKAGIRSDPSAPDKEAVLRAFARRLANEVPSEYVFGLDMGLTENDAAIISDELGRGSAVGLPAELGGLPYDQLGITGFGVAEATDAAAQSSGLTMQGARVAIQGFGAVGVAAGLRLVALGATVTAIATSKGTLVAPDGLDVERLVSLRNDEGHGDEVVAVYDDPSAHHVPDASAVLDVPVDILVPAAREDVIHHDVARRTTAQLVVEGANMPTTPEARAILHERGVILVPDFIANAGGIVAAAFSMDARHSAFATDPDRVFASVSATMRSNTRTVLDESARTGSAPHEAAWGLAQDRVRTAMTLRGQVTGEAR